LAARPIFAYWSAECRVVPGRGQQSTVTVGRAGVQFEAEHAQRIHTNTYRAFGITRLHIEDEALGPLFSLGRPWLELLWPSRKSRLK
jgi:hypothetical protein